MKKDFVPGRNSNLNSFVENFINQLNKYSEELTMSSIDVEEAKNILEKHKNSFSKMVSLKAESKSATEEYYTGKKDTIDLIRRLSKQIKSSKKYNTAFGEAFLIINRYSADIDFSGHKPVIKAKVNGSRVIIKFTKDGTDGIKLYSKRGTESKFSELVVALRGTYTDKRPKLSGSIPEVREYYAVYIVKDEITGLRSDEIKVIIP